MRLHFFSNWHRFGCNCLTSHHLMFVISSILCSYLYLFTQDAIKLSQTSLPNSSSSSKKKPTLDRFFFTLSTVPAEPSGILREMQPAVSPLKNLKLLNMYTYMQEYEKGEFVFWENDYNVIRYEQFSTLLAMFLLSCLDGRYGCMCRELVHKCVSKCYYKLNKFNKFFLQLKKSCTI